MGGRQGSDGGQDGAMGGQSGRGTAGGPDLHAVRAFLAPGPAEWAASSRSAAST